MKLAVDSNRVSDFFRGIAEVVEIFETAEILFVPLIVIAEQRAGFALGKNTDRNERLLTQFLSTNGVAVLAPDEQTTHHYAEIYASLRKRGKPIAMNDLWIASLCVQHSVPLYTRDRDFELIPRLARV